MKEKIEGRKKDGVREFLKEICPEILQFDTAAVLNCRVAGNPQPAIKDEYVLAKITKESRQKALENKTDYPKPCWSGLNYCVLAFNRTSKGRMSLHRFSTYVFNRFRDSEMNRFGNIGSYSIDLKNMEYEYCGPKGSEFEIPADVFDLMFALDEPGAAKIDDFDIKLITDKIDRKNDGRHIFKNIDRFRSPRVLDEFVPSLNFFNNRHYGNHAGMLQRHEREVAQRLLEYRKRQGGDLTAAVIDLALDGRDTNLVEFTENPKIATYLACKIRHKRPGSIVALPKSAFEIRDKIEYPAADDFILCHEPVGIRAPVIKARSSVFVYCSDGFLGGSKYDGFAEEIMIPQEAADLLAERTGLQETDVYPDERSLLSEPWNLRSSVSEVIAAANR